ncbi:MAG TPA: PrsW family intramembrane metalloprotease [Candidatus Vogelbacteria bacterium]|nr:PrsW family intramembrane metalloprotease [Candidatus Vogelbacteria bacterium]
MPYQAEIINLVLSVIAGFLPAIFWLWFWLKQDKKKPEPKRILLKTFFFGAVMVFLATMIQKSLNDVSFFQKAGQKISLIISSGFSLKDIQDESLIKILFLAFFVWALIEEVLKFLAAKIAAFDSQYFDEPIDAMIYLITAALGFAAMENTLHFFTDFHYPAILITGNLRFLGATLVHAVSSAIVGGFIALNFCKSPEKREAFVWLGLFFATLLHTLFNLFIIITSGSGQYFLTYLSLWVIAVFLIWFFEKVKVITCSNN